MAVTDPQAIKFINEIVRSNSEKIRDIAILIAEARTEWFNQIQSLVPNSAIEDIEDGRDGEGVSRLTGEDVHNFMARMEAIWTEVTGVANEGVIRKPNVRGVSLNSGF